MKHILFPMAMIATMATSCRQIEITNVQVTQYQGERRAAISLTFDDGMLCHYTDVAPALEQCGLRGTFWIIGSNMGRDDAGYPWMTWQQVADLAQRGHEISNHSWTHPDLTKLTEEQLRWEIAHNDSVIESVTGKKPITFCYPYNAFNDSVEAICSEGRVGTRTFWESQGQRESHQTLETMTAWMQRLVDNGEWGVTMTHGTTYGWDMWDDPQQLYDFFSVVQSAADSVWTAPFADVAAYIAERNDLHLSWTSNGNTLVITPTLLSLNPSLYTEPLTLGIDADFTDVDVTATQGTQKQEVEHHGSYLLINAVPSGEELIVRW